MHGAEGPRVSTTHGPGSTVYSAVQGPGEQVTARTTHGVTTARRTLQHKGDPW